MASKKRPQFKIIGYVDERTSTYILETEYRETPQGPGKIEYQSFLTLRKLNKEMLKAIEHAKRNNYNYKVELKAL